MIRLPVTTLTLALLGLIFVYLTVRVIMARGTTRTMLGDGGAAGSESPLFVAVRSHANFAEFVPLCLLLLGAVEATQAPRLLCVALAAALVLARVMHPVGMGMKAPNVFRAGGVMLTLGMMLVASFYLVVLVTEH